MLRTHALALFALTVVLSASACTIEDVQKDIRIVETVPRPSSGDDTHRLTRSVGLGGESDRVEQGEITGVRLRVTAPDGADLFPFLSIELHLLTSEANPLLARGTDFRRGEQDRELDVEYTGDVKPFLQAEDLQIEWRIRYKSSEIGSYPATGIEVETVIGFSIDVRLI